MTSAMRCRRILFLPLMNEQVASCFRFSSLHNLRVSSFPFPFLIPSSLLYFLSSTARSLPSLSLQSLSPLLPFNHNNSVLLILLPSFLTFLIFSPFYQPTNNFAIVHSKGTCHLFSEASTDYLTSIPLFSPCLIIPDATPTGLEFTKDARKLSPSLIILGSLLRRLNSAISKRQQWREE